MGRSFNSLMRVIDLESKQDFQDKAVVGGIRQFAAFWVSQAREEAADEVELALIEQIAETLSGYSRLPGREARATAIEQLKDKLRKRQQRLAQSKPARQTKPVAPSRTRPPRKKAVSRIKEPERKPEPIEPDPDGLRQPVTMLRGVGPKAAERLENLGVKSIWDLLYLFPHRYDDYSTLIPINRLSYGEQVTIIGTVWETRARQVRNHKLVQSIITDGTGKIQATWFNQPWLTEKIKAGMRIVLSGKVDQFLGRPVLQNPAWEPLEIDPLRTRRIVPVYPLTKGLTAQKIREIMKRVLGHWALRVPDSVPDAIRKRQKLARLPFAIQQAHFPDTQESLHLARKRIIFDELFLLQLGMLGLRRDWQSAPGMVIPPNAEALSDFHSRLAFELTGAQKRVINEIAADMAKSVPMNRLLQGDVGSGKTVVAASAMVLAVKAGLQAAMMAPTEILAEQHYQSLSSLFSEMGVNVMLLTGRTPAAEKERIYASLDDASAHVVVGTHALIQESVHFQKLGLAIIDEQHRFGVDQRKALREKGFALPDGAEKPNPHLLVMSATPIPRTLALSLYGDLDLSTLDEMPPGRLEIKTHWLRPGERERAYAFVRGQIEQGRQAFVICPLVEDSKKMRAKAAVDEYNRLREQIFPDLKLGLLHGRLKADEKEEAMRAFYAGETNIMVATSVIEVGIDVPNSTVMLIEGANHFGLAQLHQFRGRVGRGEHQSFCLLLADSVSGDAEDRLKALEQTNDGFLLAEKDLEIRGPGEFLGRRQSGLPELQLASLTDMEMLQIAREEALALYEVDPDLKQPAQEFLRQQVERFWRQAGDIS